MVVIRDIADADFEAVGRVHARTWQHAYAGIVPAEVLDALDPVRMAEYRRRMPRRPGQQTVVADDGGTIAGFASFGPYRRHDTVDDYDLAVAELYAIYVDPSYWDAGVGRRLMAEVLASTTGAYGELRLWVLEENARARRFYERAGMTPDGAREMFTPRNSTAELPEIRYAMRLQ
jgi:ribosomal protein S18 acetylase RimI-like enzyme